MSSRLSILAICFAVVHAHRIIGDATQSLNSVDGASWSVTNGTSTVPASIPGDLITDLAQGGVVPKDPLYELNFKGNAWDVCNWTYSTSFALNADVASASSISLVLDGVKMVSDVSLNGVALGYTADQFLRYTFDVTAAVKRTGANTLTVTFPTGADARNIEQRWASCSGGWDWAPYSTTEAAKAKTFSKGIWLPVYLVGVKSSSAAIEHVSPRVFYNGEYPTEPLTDDSHGDFSVDVVVHMTSPAATSGTLTATGAWVGGSASVPVTLPAGASNVTVTLPAANNAVKLWWPAQTPGAQNLYNITVEFTEAGGIPKVAMRRVGFRILTLVTGNDTDPSTLAGKDGQDGFTMRFKVNGANIWSRGSNMIPMEELEGRHSDAAHRRLVQSAAEAGFNTFRLWGGGIYQLSAWYDACDEFGIIIYHDAMYAQGNHAPAATPMQTAEVQYQIRRLAEHPSIGIWDGCNECNGHGIYADFVMTTIAAEDPSRPPWPSCPSHGWASGVDRLWSLPNGSPLGLQPIAPPPANASAACTDIPNMDFAHGSIGPLPSVAATSAADCCAKCAAHTGCAAATFVGQTCWLKNVAQSKTPDYVGGVTGVWPQGSGPVPPLPTPTPPPPPGPLACQTLEYETHGPYQHGEGFNTVNSGGSLAPFVIPSPPTLKPPGLTGPSCPGTYASEFGGVAISTFESLSPTLDPSHWGLHAPPMSERNYAVDNFVVAVANLSWPADFVGIGETELKGKVYFSMLSQALFIKADVEARRSQNSWGCITWQFNEIWPTGGWGSIEYGTVGFTAGQVEGGRWKVLQYLYKRYIYTDVLIVADDAARLFIKNDNAFSALSGVTSLSFLHLPTGQRVQTPLTIAVSLPRGAGASNWTCVNNTVDVTTADCPSWPSILTPAGCAADGSDCIALLEIRSSAGALISENFVLLAQPFALSLPSATVTFAIGAPAADGTVPITLTASATAVFVTLTTLAQGRFSDNALLLSPGETTVNFIPWAGFDAGLLASSLRVEHLGTYARN